MYNFFSDTSQQASKKCENWRPFFKTQKNKTKQENKCKTCPTNIGNRQNLVFFFDTTEKESLTEVYKDSKNCEERV